MIHSGRYGKHHFISAYKAFVRLIAVAFLLQIFGYGNLQAQDCSDLTSQQRAEVQNYMNTIVPIILYKLHPQPHNDGERRALLDSLKSHDYTSYAILLKNINSFIEQTSQAQQTCFYSLANNYNVGDWIGFFYRSNAPANKSLSPEFKKGFGLLAEVNQGVIDPFQQGEQYLLTAKSLLAYTFSREHSGGRLRMLLGPSLSYSDQEVQFFLTSRAEIRVFDLKANPVSLGTIKLLLEGSTDLNGYWIGGPGAGFEFPNFGFQALYQWHTGAIDQQLELGISYRFLN